MLRLFFQCCSTQLHFNNQSPHDSPYFSPCASVWLGSLPLDLTRDFFFLQVLIWIMVFSLHLQPSLEELDLTKYLGGGVVSGKLLPIFLLPFPFLLSFKDGKVRGASRQFSIMALVFFRPVIYRVDPSCIPFGSHHFFLFPLDQTLGTLLLWSRWSSCLRERKNSASPPFWPQREFWPPLFHCLFAHQGKKRFMPI